MYGENEMFAVGHLALGYLFAKVSQKLLKINVNLPLILLLSLIPDVDLLIPSLIHRGPTHSIIIITIVFAPFFLLYKKKCIPYFAAITQHTLIGDFITGAGIQMFWPLTSNWYGLEIEMRSFTNISIEWTSFLISIIILIRTKDLQRLFKPKKSNLLLTVPSGIIFLSSIIGLSRTAPIELLIPHITYLTIFTFSTLKFISTKKQPT